MKLLLFLCFLNGLLPSIAAGQRIQGRVTQEVTGDPLQGVTVTLLDSELVRVAVTTTDGTGHYVLRDVRPASYWIRFQLPGFHPTSVGPLAVTEDVGVEYSVKLRPARPVIVDMVVVEGERVPRYLEDFYRRKAQRSGSYLTQQDIERYWPARATDLIPRLSGFELYHGGDGDVRVRTRRPASLSRGRCPPLLFVDGVVRGTTDSHPINDFLWVDGIAAVEAYDGPAKMPPEFNMTGSACGAIVIWTKR